MAWYNFWKKKEEPKEFILTPDLRIVKSNTDPTKVRRNEWRNGMWVMTSKGVGIIFQMGNDLLIHLVDPKTGETVNATIEHRQAVRQARYDEIPACRKVGLTKERAEFLGYM